MHSAQTPQVSGFVQGKYERNLFKINSMNNFQIKSLQDTEFLHLFKLEHHELEKMGAIKMIVDKKPGFPCRVSLQDAEVGEEVILLPYQHHQTHSPYRSAGPIFVRKNAATASLSTNEIPKMLEKRLLSIRGYNKYGMMKEAHVCEGQSLREILDKIFADASIDYAHIHSAKQGCYNCKVERV